MNKKQYEFSRFFTTDNGIVSCTLCPRYCQLKNGQKGSCLTKMAVDGKLASLNYGRLCGLRSDPIEKKPIYHYLPGTSTYSFGTTGCNLFCSFCQNSGISRAGAESENLPYLSPEEIVSRAITEKCSSVAFTYNEPVISADYIIQCAPLIKEAGLKNILVSSGFITAEASEILFPYIDCFNIDLKSFDNNFYKKYCKAQLEPVLDSLKLIKKLGKHLEITTLIIPELNENSETLNTEFNWVIDNLGENTPLHLSAFHPAYKMQATKPTSPLSLIKIRESAMTTGLKYVYTGNINNPEGGQTSCPHCSNILIKRDGYSCEIHGIKNNRCKHCDNPVDIYLGDEL